MAQKGKSIFQQSNASVDVTTLMNAWLKTVQDLQKKNRTDDAEFQKMKLLQSYVPSWRKVEFLIVWKPTQRFLSSLVSLRPKTTDKVFTDMDPELKDFKPNTFQAHLKYAKIAYQFDQAAYYDGIETFPAKKTNRYAFDYATLFANTSEPHCRQFMDDSGQWELPQ